MRKGHEYIGWREAETWRCMRCGYCCKAFAIPLKFIEALELTRRYGPVAMQIGEKYYLVKRNDGSCIFLRYNGPIAYCQIYLERPGCCRLYPFHITKKPLKGEGVKNAKIKINGTTLYLYVDAACPGVGVGYPIKNIIYKIVELWEKYKKYP